MAGDWIKLRIDLWDSPKVVRISSALQADKATTIGALFRTWSIGDLYTEDGRLDGYTAEALDCAVGIHGWSEALASVGWLELESQAIVIPRFEEHNGQSAKRRAQDTSRKKRVRKTSAPEADKMRTREEKRREDKCNPPLPSLKTLTLREGFNTPAVRERLNAWFSHLSSRNRAPLDPLLQAVEICRMFSTPQELVDNITAAIGNGYTFLKPYVQANQQKQQGIANDDPGVPLKG